MDLNKFFGSMSANMEMQEAGGELELLHPVDGTPTGLKIWVAGPDSKRQRSAMHCMENELRSSMAGSMNRRRGYVTAEVEYEAETEFLTAIITRWDISDNGEALPFEPQNVHRILCAGTWMRTQIKAFARSRKPYFEHSAKKANENG